MKIYKYQLGLQVEQEIEMPFGASILCVQTQKEIPYIWALVNENEKDSEYVCFHIIGTGNLITILLGRYVGTFQLSGGSFIGHVFEGVRS